MPSNDTKILEFNQYQKSDKAPFIISGDPEGIISSFTSIENKHDIYRGKDCMKKFCEFLREHTMKIINFIKKKMKLLTRNSRNHMKMQKFVIFVKKNLKINI